jgi:hypothetical protein
MPFRITFTGKTDPSVKASGDQVVEVVEHTAKKTEEAAEKTKSFGANLQEVGKIAGGILLGAGIMKAPGFLMDAAKGAAEDEQATIRLNKSLENLAAVDNMLTFDELRGAVDELIEKGGDLAFSDDEIRDSLQGLIAATGSADESMVRLAAAQDLARGANIPLATASKMLGKLNEENVEVFKKMGITLGENATEADALALVQQKFGGQAEAYAKSTAGQFEVAQIKMAEAKETIGAALLPVLTFLAGVLSGKVIPAVEMVVNNLDKIAPVLIPVGAAILAMGAAIGITMIPALVTWLGVQIPLALAVVATYLPIVALVAGIGLLAAGVVLLIQHWDEVTAKFPILGVVADAIKEKLDVVVAWLSGPFADGVAVVGDAVEDSVGRAVDFVAEHWPEIQAIIEPALKAIGLVIKFQLDVWLAIFETAWGIVRGVFKMFTGILHGDVDEFMEGLRLVFSSGWDGIVKVIGLAIDLITELGPLLLKAGGALGDAFMNGLKAALSASAGFIGDVGAALLSAIKGVINSQVIDRINSALQFDFDTHIPGVGTVSINPQDIPYLASGGIVTSPTLAVIGEKGPEAVIPLSSANARGGSLLGVGLGETPGARPATTGSGSITNLSLAELKSIKDHTAKSAAELDNQEGFLAATSKALYSGSTKAADFLAQMAEGLEVLPEIWIMLRDIRDLLSKAQAPAFGTGA